MTLATVQLWDECVAVAPVSVAGRIPVLACCDWLRLLLGSSLTMAQPRVGKWHFLVHGVPLEQLQAIGDKQGLALAVRAARRDFAELRSSLEELKGRIRMPSSDAPEVFLRSYLLLWALRLPMETKHWRVTDEGLQIVQWGLDAGRPLFEWTQEQISAIERACLGSVDSPSRGNASVRDTERSGAQRRVGYALHPSFVAERVAPTPDTASGDDTASEVKPAHSGSWLSDPLWWSVLVLVLVLGVVGGALIGRWSVSAGAARDQVDADLSRGDLDPPAGAMPRSNGNAQGASPSETHQPSPSGAGDP